MGAIISLNQEMYNSSEGSSGVVACAVLGTDIERNASFTVSTSCGALCTASKLFFIKMVSLMETK